MSEIKSTYKLKNPEKLNLTEKWDKVFPLSDKVNHRKVTYINRFGITLAADLYIPKNVKEKLPAIAVGSPYGAVKEQAGGIYAMKMAELGYITLAFDPSFNGESGGNIHHVSSPDINTEDFCASVDYLVCLDNVDPEKIGIIGICGYGGLAISAAAMDPRIKATVSSTMGSFDDHTHESRIAERKKFAALRTKDAQNGTFNNSPTLPKPCPKDAPDFIKDYCNFYHTKRGYHPRSINSALGWNSTSMITHITFSLFDYVDEIKSAVLLIHGEKAFSLYASQKVIKLLKGDNKELFIVKGASHCDLYDGGGKNLIPFDKIDNFFKKYLSIKKQKPSSEHLKNQARILDDKRLWLICPKCKNFPLLTPKFYNDSKEISINLKCRCNNYKEEQYSIKEYFSQITHKQKNKVSCTNNSSHNGYLAINYCFQCKEFLCSLCCTIHNTLNKDHIISDEAIKIDKICDRHLEDNEIVSYCDECNMNLCNACLKEHNIHHDIYDLKSFFPRNLIDKYFEDFKLIQITIFKYLNEAKKIFDEKMKEKNDDIDENIIKNLNLAYESNKQMNQDLIKLISLMFDNYYNTIDSSPNFNIIYQLRNLSNFNNCLKQFKYDLNISLKENISIFIEYLKKMIIIKTINTPLEIKEIIKVQKLNNTRILLYLGGTNICSGNWESNIQIFDLNSKKIIRNISGHFSGINSMCVINNKYIISGGCDSAMNIYDPYPEIDENCDEEGEICYKGFINGHDNIVSKIIQFKDGKVATCGHDKKINIYGKIKNNGSKEDFPIIELSDEEKEKMEKEKSEKENKEEKDKDEEIKTQGEEPKRELIYISLEKLSTFELPNKVFDICELKDGSLISCCLDKNLRIINMETLKEEKTIKIDFVPNKIACLKDGRIVISFGDRDAFGIKIFKFNKNKELILEKEFIEHTKHISSLYILEDKKIVTTSLDGTAVFYNPFEMKVVCKIEEFKKKNFTSVVQLEDRSVILSAAKGFIYLLQ